MNVLDVILLLIRWIHAVSAVAWVGGGMFYLMVLKPATKGNPLDPDNASRIARDFRSLVYSVMALLLITGIILTASKLTSGKIGEIYIIVLALKILLAGYMAFVVRFLRRDQYPEIQTTSYGWISDIRLKLTSPSAVVVAGIIVFGIADVLAFLS